MASEERDRKFEKALAHHLRGTAAPMEGAGKVEGAASASPRSGCPDAEILAAYHERSLLPEEMNSWKEHIAGCGQCRSILAHLEMTDDIPLHAAKEELVADEETVPAMDTALRASALISSTPAGAEEKSRDAVLPEPKKRDSRFSHGPRWRWLAPAGAIAAGLLVWIGMHENRSIALHSISEPKTASNSPAARPASPEETVKGLPSTTASPVKPQSLPQKMIASNGSVASKAQNKENEIALGDESKSAGAPAAADREDGLRKDAERRATDSFSRASRDSNLNAKSIPAGGAGVVGGAVKEKTEPSAPSQAPTSELSRGEQQLELQQETNANAQLQNQQNTNLQKIPGPAPLNQADSSQRLKKAATAKPQAPPPETTTNHLTYQPSPSMDLVFDSNLQLVLSPRGAAVWRIGPAGSIQFSKDKGATWSSQASGVTADLLAGSAPSEKICWLVGRAGTILLTNDGGAHWKPVNSPLSNDLGGVRATDSLHATIWDLHRTRFFETVDGGQTWSRAPAQ